MRAKPRQRRAARGGSEAGGVRVGALVAAGLVAVILLLVGGYLHAGGPLRAAREAARAGEWDAAERHARVGLERPGGTRDETELLGLALLVGGRVDEARAVLASAAELGTVAAARRAVPPQRLADRFLAEGREVELLVLCEYVEQSSRDPVEPALQARTALALLAAGRLDEARERLAALGARSDLDAPLAELVARQAERATDAARTGRIPAVLARDGTPLAWRVVATGDWGLAPELASLLGDAEPETLPGVSLSDLDGEVVTTLDASLQRLASDIFRRERGAFVALDVRSGEILAAAADADAAPLAALTSLFQPGSTLKAVTMASFLDAGLSPDELFPYRCRGNDFVLEGEILYDWTPHGAIDSLERALVLSCNTVFARAGLALGHERLREQLAPLGFADGRLAGAGGTAFPAGTVPPGPLGPRRLARTAMGLDETRVTPVQAAAMALTLARGGELLPVRLVSERRNVAGDALPPDSLPPAVRVFSADAAGRVARAMEETVAAVDGTGRGARLRGVPVAVKTGTTGGDGEPLNAVFVGFAPADEPELAFALFTMGSGRSLDVSRRVLGPFLEDLYRDRLPPTSSRR